MELHDFGAITGCFGSAGVAEGTNANTYKLTRAVSYAIDGRAYYKAATDNIAFAAYSGSLTAIGNSQTATFLICLNAAGTPYTVQSAVVDNADITSGTAVEDAAIPSDLAVVGRITVSTNASGTFTPGSTDLSAANVFDGYQDWIGIPCAPIAAVQT